MNQLKTMDISNIIQCICVCIMSLLCVSFVVFLFLGSTDHVESVMDEVEKYMMTRLYKEVFCPETTDDEKKDLAIQKRIRLAELVTLRIAIVNEWLIL